MTFEERIRKLAAEKGYSESEVAEAIARRMAFPDPVFGIDVITPRLNAEGKIIGFDLSRGEDMFHE